MPKFDDTKEWRYPLVDVLMDKRGPRTAVDAKNAMGGENAAELIGWDGQLEGGLRPHPGFRWVGRLNSDSASTDKTNKVILNKGDFFPVIFRLGTENTGASYGAIYRLTNNAGQYAVFFRSLYGNHTNFVNGAGATAIKLIDWTAYTNSPPQMDVAVKGRFIYVFVRGREPVLYYAGVHADTGPGPRPTLLAPDEAGTLQTLPTSNKGQVLLTTELPSSIGFSGQSDADVRALDPGDYVFAFQLYDSATGRKGPLSTVAPLQSSFFDTALAGGGSGSGSGSGSGTSSLFAVIEMVYQDAKWTHAYIYRSVRAQSAGGTFAAGILFQEAFIELSSYQAPSQASVPASNKRALWWYTLQDKELLYQDQYGDFFAFDEDMPQAGAATFYDDVLFCSSIQNTTTQSTTQPVIYSGEIRWSSPTEANPELFSPLSRYTPAFANDECIAFKVVGGSLIGFSRNKQYYIRREGELVRVQEIHSGYGLTSPRGAEVVGSVIYFVTPKGVQTVDGSGNLDDVRSVNKIMVEEWAGNHANVQVAYDPTMNCIFILNPDVGTGRLVCLWLKTGRVTELYNAKFVGMARGASASPATELSTTTFDTPTKALDRVLFVDTFRNVYVVDYTRVKVTSEGSTTVNGLPRTTMLDNTGDSVLTGAVTGSATKFVPGVGDVTCDEITFSLGAVGTTRRGDYTAGGSVVDADYSVVGSYLYTLPTGSHAGGYAYLVVEALPSSNKVWVYPRPTTNSDFTGTIDFSMSPVYTRWVGHQLGLLDADEMVYKASDFFRVRSMSVMGAAFSDVSGPSNVLNYAKYRGLAYRSNNSVEVASAYVTDTDGTKIRSVLNYEGINYASFNIATSSILTGKHGPEGSSLFPGLEFFVADVDYRLLEVAVLGRIRATERNARASMP